MRILVTGANGFIGNALCNKLCKEGLELRATVRSPNFLNSDFPGIDYRFVNDIGPKTDWSSILIGIDTVIHLASRVHVMNDSSCNPLEEYRRVNVLGTERLARIAADLNVRRFVFVSSCKVNGEGRFLPYTEAEDPKPEDPYGISKFEAERVLQEIARETGLEVVIIRPPLVYGPEVKANFLNLIKLVTSRLPIPLASVSNSRSLVYIGNLVDAIYCCIFHPNAIGQVFFVSDQYDVSSPDLIRKIADALGVEPRLFSFNIGLLRIFSRFLGKSKVLEKIVGTYRIDSSKITEMLGWKPANTLDEGVNATVRWYTEKCSGRISKAEQASIT